MIGAKYMFVLVSFVSMFSMVASAEILDLILCFVKENELKALKRTSKTETIFKRKKLFLTIFVYFAGIVLILVTILIPYLLLFGTIYYIPDSSLRWLALFLENHLICFKYIVPVLVFYKIMKRKGK